MLERNYQGNNFIWTDVTGFKKNFYKKETSIFYSFVLNNAFLFQYFFEDVFIKEITENTVKMKKNITVKFLNSFIKYLSGQNYQKIDTREYIKIYKNMVQNTTLYDYLMNNSPLNYFLSNFFENYVKEKTVREILKQNNPKFNLVLAGLKILIDKGEIDYNCEYIFNQAENIDIEFEKSGEILTDFEKNLFNFSFLIINSKIVKNNFSVKNFYKFINSENFVLNALILKNLIFENLTFQMNNAIFIDKSMFDIISKEYGSSKIKEMSSFLEDFEKTYKISLKKISKNEENIFFIREMFDSLKNMFLKVNVISDENKYYFKDVFRNGSSKLNQAIIENRLKSLITDIFLNGITYFGKEEKNFLIEISAKNINHQWESLNKWFYKSGDFENLLIKKGILSLILTEFDIKTVSEKIKNKIELKYLTKFIDKKGLIKQEIISESLKNLFNNFLIKPDANTKINLKETDKYKNFVLKLTVDNDGLFGNIPGMDKNKDIKDLITKIQLSELIGFAKIKAQLKQKGIMLTFVNLNKKNMEKDKEPDINII